MDSVANILDSSGSRDRMEPAVRSAVIGPPVRFRGGGFERKLQDAEQALMSGVEPRQEVLHKSVLKSLAEEITQSLTGFNSLRFSMDRELKQVVVKVVDQGTENVIRQIPSDRMVDLVKQMRDLEGMLFSGAL
ncbi:MAG: flagellar protein FlaG [Magnetococcales bacterium]|uniref:Flagellar protein FlaG n=1 Tax=Candidatus Magnetominusculus xianensis TaxID=1748249 RepID=A0ABR5SK50_9BACT|nr:flagellar protein FlaG [Candidatus Magnetominusculus xianensis]KWT93005.1 flagellar protein FlaG [Candidatus Magnetominusculus xianensis]MBF0127538.1 flagellar protein FlaG [Magnetococcales bacterium]